MGKKTRIRGSRQTTQRKSAGEMLWNALTCISALILSIVVRPFRGFVSIVIWIYKLLAFFVTWIYKLLASIVLWIYKLLASIVLWIYKLLASIVLWISERLATFAAWLYKLPASLKAWLFSCGKNGDNGQIKFTERVGGTSHLTNQHTVQQVGIQPQVSKGKTDTLRQELEQSQGQTDTLRQELEQSQIQIRNLQEDNASFQGQNDTLKRQLQKSQGQNDTLKRQLQKSQIQIRNLQEDKASFQGQNDTLKRQLQQSQIQIRNLQEDKASFQGQNDTLKRQLQKSQNQIRNLQEENARFQDENDALRRALEQSQAEVKNLQSKNEEHKTRLSKMASERMRENNTTVEDLNDPHRPTAVVTKWTSLFRCGEYWTAYEEIMSTKGESEAASTLYQICRVVYDSVKMYVDDLMGALQTVVTAATPPTENKEIEGFFPQGKERQDFLEALRTLHSPLKKDDASGNRKTQKLIVDLLKSKRPPDSMTKKVDEAVGQKVDFDPSRVKKFTDHLGMLIYYMRAQEIPMVVYFQGSKGATFDPSLYEVEGSTGTVDPKSVVIKNVIRPVVLRNESGPVLSKGEVEVMSRSAWRAEKNHKTEAKRQVSSAEREVVSSPSRDAATEDHANGAEIEDKQVPQDDGTTGALIESKPQAKEISMAEEKVAGSSSSDAAVQPKDRSSKAEVEDMPEANEEVQPAGQEIKPGGHSTEEKKTPEEMSKAIKEVSSSPPSKVLVESKERNTEAAPEGNIKDPSDLGTTSAPTGEGKKDHDHGFQGKGTSGGSCRISVYDVSDCARYALRASDDEGNDSSETQDPDKKKIVKGEAKQTASGMDGTSASVSHSVTQTSPTTSKTYRPVALDPTTKELSHDANSPKKIPSRPDEPAKSIPEKSADLHSQCMNVKADVEQTQGENGRSFPDENMDCSSTSRASSEKTENPEKASKAEINKEELERRSEISMDATGNQCYTHEQSVKASRENTQETEKQLAKQSADGDRPDLQGSPSTNLNEEHFLERSNSDPEANVINVDEPPVTTSSHRTTAQDVDMNTEPENGQQTVGEANLPGKKQSPGAETGNLESAHSNVTSPTEDRPNADDPGSEPLPDKTRDAENTKVSLKEKSPANTTTETSLVLPKPSQETIPPQEISFKAGEHSDATAKPSSQSSVIHEGNQATNPDRNESDPLESTRKNEDSHFEQSSPEPTAATCPTGTSSLGELCPASVSFSGAEEKSSLAAGSQSQEMQPESDDKGEDDHTVTTPNENLKLISKGSDKGYNFAAANAVIENATATDQEPEKIPVDPTTPQNCHNEVFGTDGNDSTESSMTEGSNQPTTECLILSSETQEGEEARNQQIEQPSHGKASSDPTLETPIPKESQLSSSQGSLSQERSTESGGSSDADSNALSDAVDQSSNLEANRTEKMGDNYAASPADRSSSLNMTSPTNEGAEELATEKAAGESSKEADKQDEDMPESIEGAGKASIDDLPLQDS